MSLLSWFKKLTRRQFDDDDLQEEIRAHIAIAEAERMAEGADRKAAHQASLKDFGNVTLTREDAKRVWTPRWLETLRDLTTDIRYAIRSLGKAPAFAVTVVGVLTIGIGVNAAVFTMLKSIAFAPLSGVKDSAGLRVVYGETSVGRDVGLSYPDYVYLRDHDTSFAGLYGHRLTTLTLGRGRGAHQASGEFVTGNYFDLLDVKSQLGRTLQPADEAGPGRPSAVVISDALWRRDFEADPAIVGKSVELNNHMLTIVGVTEPSYHGTIVSYDVDLFLPLMIAPDLGLMFGSSETTPSGVFADTRANMLYVLGHLRPGVTMAQAAASTNAIWADLSRDRALGAQVAEVQNLRVVPFLQYPTSAQATVLPMLIALSAMGLLVLVIACANIGGLVAVRSVSRRGEVAMRLALGASRARIIRLLIVENLVLAIPGALLGMFLASRAMPVLFGYAQALAAPQRLFFNMQTDALVIGFAAAVACGCALIFGLLPALRSSRINLAGALQDDSPRGTGRGKLRAALVIAQVAVSLMLLVGAGLVTRSLDAAEHADLGFKSDGVTAIRMDLKANGYDEARGRAFYRQLLDAARNQPGVESASLATSAALTFIETKSQRVAIDGYETRRGEDLSMLSNIVAPDYFRTLSVPVVAGREFDGHDDEAAMPVAVVNRTLAEKFWGGAAGAIGRKVRMADGAWRTVVGVAADLKYTRINEAPRPYIYLPFLQNYTPGMILHTRGTGSMDVLIDQGRKAVAALDAELPLLSALSLHDATRGALIFYTFMSSMLFLFGMAGMALAAMGTYGLVSYTVRQSTREIGIRMALGASGLEVVRSFLARGVRLGLIGIAIGAVAALGLGNVLRNVLFGVSPTDGRSFLSSLAIVLSVVLVATLVPAWRASRTDPLRALRHQ